MLSQDKISPAPLDTVCELLTISSDSSIRSTFHYPLSGVGRHEDKEGSRARVETNSKKHGQGPNMANSFVARLISLTARNEIRYEGI
jgi:lipase chaperone LimK